ncbi:hypothetical protein LSH36_6g07057 [Paralvinella palmiformis]|uniref:Uncharacterized protein n=1 Tax=Paralvinella palmiformis TaxID=53620 RepID=A0AAD9NJW9_9ANNE|nr:hypothetical protein LSH36_6g07057 [Paralvinella palmiformis]
MYDYCVSMIDSPPSPLSLSPHSADIRLQEQREALAVVSFDGTVLWIPMAIYRSTCSIDILYFPYDSQTCKLKFGSWTYDGFKLDLAFYKGLDEVDLTDYMPSNEWNLISSPAKRNIRSYPCCNEPYPDLTFTIQVSGPADPDTITSIILIEFLSQFELKRLAVYYTFLLILPCVLLSILTLVIFWLPPESAAKMLLGMNIFVAFFLLLRILAESTPPASASVPLIGAYFCLNMVLITLSSFLSVIVINVYHRNDKKNKVPDWLRKFIVHGLSRFFGLNYAQVKVNTSRARCQDHVTHVVESPARSRKNSKDKKKIRSPVLSYNKWEPPPFAYTDSPIATRHPNPERPSQLLNQMFEADVKEIKRVLRNFMAKLRDRDAAHQQAMEWRVVALVLDRIFFLIYVITIGIALATLFPWEEATGSY